MAEHQLYFSMPKLRFFRWLTTTKTIVSAEIQTALISSLYSAMGIFLGGAVTTFVVAAATAYRHPEPLFIGWLICDMAIGLIRVPLAFYCRRLALQGKATPTDLHLFFVLVWACGLGLGTIATALTGDWPLIVMAWVAYAAMAGGMCFRNYGAPRLATIMLVLAMGPIIPASVILGEPVVYILALQAMAYIFTMRTAIKNLNAVLLKAMHAEIEQAHRAQHDPLTGLRNRAGLDQIVRQTMGQQKHCRPDTGVICVDLDGFKPVNDTHGHAAGDALLVMVAARIMSCLDQTAFVARMGGDEFVILAQNQNHETLAFLAQTIVTALCHPYELSCGKKLKIGGSAGAAMPSNNSPAFDDVLRQADKALYRAKSVGGNSVCLSIDGHIMTHFDARGTALYDLDSLSFAAKV